MSPLDKQLPARKQEHTHTNLHHHHHHHHTCIPSFVVCAMWCHWRQGQTECLWPPHKACLVIGWVAVRYSWTLHLVRTAWQHAPWSLSNNKNFISTDRSATQTTQICPKQSVIPPYTEILVHQCLMRCSSQKKTAAFYLSMLRIVTLYTTYTNTLTHKHT